MRVKGGPTTRQRRKKWLNAAEGTFGTRHTSYRVAKQTIIQSAKYAFRDRKAKKRTFRSLWIARLNAALRARGVTYSVFMAKLRTKGYGLNRKMLSELAIREPATFSQLVETVIS